MSSGESCSGATPRSGQLYIPPMDMEDITTELQKACISNVDAELDDNARYDSDTALWCPSSYQSEGEDGDFHSASSVRQKEYEAMYKAIAEMVQEIPWLKRLWFRGFDKRVPAYQKMEKLQKFVKTRR